MTDFSPRPYMHPSAETEPAQPSPDSSAAPNAPSPTATATSAYPLRHCQGCGRRAGMLRAIGDGPALCTTCHEHAEFDAREKANEPARQALAVEVEKIRERHRLEALRPPNSEFDCALGSAHGRAEILRGGLLLCRGCAEKTDYDPSFSYPEAPVILLEARVAELSSRLAALEAVLAQPAPKTARKSS